MEKKNKKGDLHIEYVIVVILGLITMLIILFWMFNEYFTATDTDWEVCRQSVVLRAQAIEKGDSQVVSELAEKFPFKCKTEKVEIDYKDYEKAGLTIVDEMAKCWALYGKGENFLYARNYFIPENSCFYCARIHFALEVAEYYSPEGYMKEHGLVDEFSGEMEKVYSELKQAEIHYGLTYGATPEELQKSIDDWKSDILNKEAKLGTLDKSSLEYADLKDVLEQMNSAIPGFEGQLVRATEEYQIIEEIRGKIDYSFLQEVTLKYNEEFNIGKFLTRKMKNSNISYAEYLFGTPVDQTDLFLKNFYGVGKEPIIDGTSGDLIVSHVFFIPEAISSWVFLFPSYPIFYNERGWASYVSATQNVDSLKCDIVETIPG
ncbi:MAG: hypothetical protein ABIF88_01730 [archaeon]